MPLQVFDTCVFLHFSAADLAGTDCSVKAKRILSLFIIYSADVATVHWCGNVDSSKYGTTYELQPLLEQRRYSTEQFYIYYGFNRQENNMLELNSVRTVDLSSQTYVLSF